MIDKFNKSKIFSRRLFFIFTIKLTLVFILILRLIYLQLLKFSKFNILSDSNSIKSLLVPPLRGDILDKNNIKIAENISYYRILYNPVRKHKSDNVLNKLSEILDIPKKDFIYHKDSSRKSSDGYFLVYDNLTWQEISKVEVNIPNLPGVIIETAQKRHYPFKEITSQVLGYVSAVGKKEAKNSNNILLKHPDFKIGKVGLERTYEQYLRGKAGIKHIEVDANNFTVRNKDLPHTKSITGDHLQLSLDLELQKYSYNLVKDKQAGIVTLNIETGEILTLISTPSFDSNNFVSGISHKNWQKLLNNEAKPMLNRVVNSTYPPGSTFKLLVALAALEKKFNPKTSIVCNGKVRLGRRYFHCWKKSGHKKTNLLKAIEQSCNIYFYNLVKSIGINKVNEVAKKFGITEVFNIGLLNEKKGLLPDREWKKRVLNDYWALGDSYNSIIGQGAVGANILQLAVMTARLASKGKKILPTLLKQEEAPNFEQIADIDQKNIEFVLKGMFKVVNSRKGTAYYSRIRKKGWDMSGKTGTSQVVAIDHKDKKKQSEIEFSRRNHGIFVGFAPYDKPKYAVAILIEHGGSGSGSAAPIARRILRKLRNKTKA